MNDPTPAPRTRIFPFLLAATAAFVLALSWSLKQSAAWYLAGFVAAGRGGAT